MATKIPKDPGICQDHNETLQDIWSNGHFLCESCFLEYAQREDLSPDAEQQCEDGVYYVG